MTGWPLLAALVAAYGLVVAGILLWVRNARDAGERFDQVMRDHYSDEEGD